MFDVGFLCCREEEVRIMMVQKRARSKVMTRRNDCVIEKIVTLKVCVISTEEGVQILLMSNVCLDCTAQTYRRTLRNYFYFNTG